MRIKISHHKLNHISIKNLILNLIDLTMIEMNNFQKKIKESQKKLNEIVIEAQNETVKGINKQLIDYYENYRNEDSFDTSFIYQLQDISKYGIIQKAIQKVRALISYAFLFNQNMFEYEFIDKRSKPKNISFAIKRQQSVTLISQINIELFKYNFYSSYNISSIQFKQNHPSYILAKKIKQITVAGIPIQIDSNNNWKIVKVDQNLPQIFKDFPLIGSTPINWNAVINSSQFYPNEDRSSLMLKSIDKGNADKVSTNKQNLLRCFQGVKDLYLFLAQLDCRAGLSNLIIFNEQNELTSFDQSLKCLLVKFIDEITDNKFIPVIKGKEQVRCKLKQLCFISQRTHFKDQKLKKQMSRQINQVFQFLYSSQNIIINSQYYEFYDVIESNDVNKDYLKSRIKIFNLNDCLKKLQKNQSMITKCQDIFQQLAFKKLHNIYQILTRHQIQVWNYCIYLNQNNQFRKLDGTDSLMKKSISINQEKFLEQLKIQFKDKLIHEQFASYFTKILKYRNFDNKKIEQLLLKHFQPNEIKETMQLQEHRIRKKYPLSLNSQIKIRNQLSKTKFHQLKTLYRLIISFKKIPENSIKKLKQLLIFKDINPFIFFNQMNSIKTFTFQNNFFKKLLQFFAFYLKGYFYHQVQFQPTLKIFALNTLKNQINDVSGYLKDLFTDEIFGSILASIPIKLSIGQSFTEEYKLNRLSPDIDPPNDLDIQIYDILNKNAWSQTRFKSLKQIILLGIYPKQSTLNILHVTYNQIIQIKKFDTINSQKDKRKVLRYLKQINNSFLKSLQKDDSIDKTLTAKYNAWKGLINKRHFKMFQIINQKDYLNEEMKQFIFQLMDDPNELKKVASDYFKRKRPAQQNEQISSTNGLQIIKKTKIE